MNHPFELLVVSHGSSVDPESYRPLVALVDQMRRSGLVDGAQVGFLKQSPTLAQGWEKIRGSSVVVLPYLASAGFFAQRILPEKLGFPHVEFDVPFEFQGRTVVYTRPIGTHGAVIDVVEQAALEIADGATGPEADQTTLVVVGHGTPRHRASGQSVRECVAELQRRGRFAHVLDAFVDEEPFVDGVLERCPTGDVVVLPYFVCDGPHVREDIPQGLGIGRELWGAPHRVGDHRVWYGRALLARDEMAAVVESQLSELRSE